MILSSNNVKLISLKFNNLFFVFLGESIVVWKHGESVIFAGEIRIRKDLHIRLVDGTSLLINEATRSYAGKMQLKLNHYSG